MAKKAIKPEVPKINGTKGGDLVIQDQPRAHSVISPSKMHRVLACPSSALLEAMFPETENEFAIEGKIAHALADKTFNELKPRLKELQNAYNLDTLFDEVYKVCKSLAPKKESKDPIDESKDMATYVSEHLTRALNIYYGLLEIDPTTFIASETKLDLSALAEGQFGTADIVIIGNFEMHVIDLKYGKGQPVYAYENPQLLSYAYGCYSVYNFLYEFETAVIHIHQPRLETFTEYYTLVTELLEWVAKARIQVDLALSGNGETNPGEHCQFCKAAPRCKARANHAMNLLKIGKDFKLLTLDEQAKLFPLLDNIEKFCKTLKADMLSNAIGGLKYPGLKLVEGRKGNRRITDGEGVIATFPDIAEACFYEKKFVSITTLEQLVGKTGLQTLLEKGYIEQPDGSPSLVAESDKRPEYKRADAILAAFEVLE